MSRRLVSPKSVRRIVVLGENGPVTIHARKRKKSKKQDAWLKPFEKAERRMLRGASRFIQTYRDRHDRSNRSTHDGWLRDMERNIFRAERKAGKVLKLRKL